MLTNPFLRKVINDELCKELVEKSDKLIQTSIENSIIDLYTCASSNKFIGTYWLSYSGFIKKLQKLINSNIE